MRKNAKYQAFVVVFAVVAISSCADKHSDYAEKSAEKLKGKIKAEIASLEDHEWAGEYYYGDGLGVNVSLAIAPKSGCVFAWYGCLGLYDRNYGAVKMRNGRLCLSFTFPNERERFQGIADELIPVAWGPRKYLIPPDDMIDFCNAVNSGSEPRPDVHGQFFLRDDDGNIKVKGFPIVPPEFRAYLLKDPITAEIATVGKQIKNDKGLFRETQITLNKGKKHGLLPGMELYVTSPPAFVNSVRITKVENSTAEGILSQFSEESALPKVGWKLSTWVPWRHRQEIDNKETAEE